MRSRFFCKIVGYLIVSSMFLSVNPALAQDQKETEDEHCSSFATVDFGADIVSRYVWRGNELGTVDGNSFAAPHIQPYGSLDLNFDKAGILSLGIWGSYAFTGNYSENDFILKYTLPLSFGSVSASVTDYYFPYVDSIKFSDFKGNGEGAHTVEAALSITGPEEYPFSLLVSKNIHNDPADSKSFYIETGYSFSINEIPVSLFIGAAQGFSLWHNITTDKVEITNVGFSISKNIKLTNDYSLPVGLSFAYNPHIENSYLVFKLTL